MVPLPHGMTIDTFIFQNLSLFGFDIILESGTKKPVIIDINYFPGYDGFENFHEILSDMLYQAAIS